LDAAERRRLAGAVGAARDGLAGMARGATRRRRRRAFPARAAGAHRAPGGPARARRRRRAHDAGAGPLSRHAAPPGEDRLLDWRPEFPTVEATLHFISHSLGAMPRAAEESLRRYADTWKRRSIRAWEEQWFELPAQIGDTIAGIVGGAPGSVSMLPNTTLAQASALSALSFAAPRNRLVCTAEDFPSILYLYQGLARRGVEVVRVPARENRRVYEEDVIAAVDERTAVVAVSQVLFRTSQVLDVAPIVRC